MAVEGLRTRGWAYCLPIGAAILGKLRPARPGTSLRSAIVHLPLHGLIASLYLCINTHRGIKMQQSSIAALLGKADLCDQLQISERALENMVKGGTFPPPVRIGKRVYWSETSVQKWQDSLFAAQESWSLH